MKIRSVSVQPYDITLNEPFSYASMTLNELRYALVLVETDYSMLGFGEVATAWDVTGETRESAIDMQSYVEPLLRGRTCDNIHDVRACMNAVEREIAANEALKAGIEAALLDCVGKMQGKCIGELFGVAVSPVRGQVVISFGEFQHVHAGLLDLSNATSIKVKCGKDFDEEIRLLRTLRQRYPKTSINIDVNQGWSLDETIAHAGEIKELGIAWMEQPLRADLLDEFVQLRRTTDVPVMLDESVRTLRDVKLSHAYGCLDMVNVKLAKCGGLFEAQRIFTWCDAHAVPYAIGDMVQSALGTASNLFAAALGTAIVQDLTSMERLKDDPSSGITEKDGLFAVSGSAGLGITVFRA